MQGTQINGVTLFRSLSAAGELGMALENVICHPPGWNCEARPVSVTEQRSGIFQGVATKEALIDIGVSGTGAIFHTPF